MPYLIDGDNLLGTWPGRQRSDGERREVAMELHRFSLRSGRRVMTIFDGSGTPGISFGGDVEFSGPGRSADVVILERLRREGDPRGWTVVTSDRSLGDQCRWVGARVLRCDQFRGRLRDDGGSEKPQREDDVDYWLREFGEDVSKD